MACRLGCDAVYKVTVTDRCARNTLLELDDFTRLTWGRVLDDVSQATVTVPADCCGKLSEARAWGNELHISRNDDEVWCGPLIVQPNCRSGITLVAQDMLAWLGRRVVRTRHCYDPDCGRSGRNGPTIANDLIQEALLPDDPCLLKWLQLIQGGEAQERDYKANSAYVIDALKDLAKGGLDFTAVGRRIVIMPEGHELGRTALLSCDSFAGDVCVTEDGAATATRVVVTGTQGDTTTIVAGAVGGIDPYYGLIEVLHTDSTIKTAAAARAQARGILAGANPTPLLVQPPQGSSLSPDAAVCMSELVPGVVSPVVMDCLCRNVGQSMRLLKLDVSVDASGETVSPLYVPTGQPGVDDDSLEFL